MTLLFKMFCDGTELTALEIELLIAHGYIERNGSQLEVIRRREGLVAHEFAVKRKWTTMMRISRGFEDPVFVE